MIGLSFSCVLFIVFIICYIASKQYEKGTGSRLALELISVASMFLFPISICAGISGI